MAYTTINKPTDYFNTVLYTGNGSTQSITGVGFQPDWTWIKPRSVADNHVLFDSVRGVTKRLVSNLNSAEVTVSDMITSFDSDGFSLGTNSNVSGSGRTFVGWNWLGGGTASSNSDGSITSSVSANTTAGFSIVKHNGTGSAGTIGHGLGAVPKMILSKNLPDASSWVVYHEGIGNTHYLSLNGTGAKADNTMWNDTTPTSSVFSVGTHNNNNDSGDDIIHYVFSEVKGFSKISSYIGNGNADGTFVYTGFKPAFIMLKNTIDTGDNWTIYDNKRDVDNQAEKLLFANSDSAESTGNNMDILSNGFKQRNTSNGNNGSGDTFIYMAFAEAPIVGTNNVPATAR